MSIAFQVYSVKCMVVDSFYFF